MKRAVAALVVALGWVPAYAGTTTGKVLRYAFPIAETSADPARVSDVYSNTWKYMDIDAARQETR